jgi:hypothetical protein
MELEMTIRGLLLIRRQTTESALNFRVWKGHWPYLEPSTVIDVVSRARRGAASNPHVGAEVAALPAPHTRSERGYGFWILCPASYRH